MGWLDNNRFLYYNFRNNMLAIGDTGNSSVLMTTGIPEGLPLLGVDFFAFVLMESNATK
jgi:hypothetical protein